MPRAYAHAMRCMRMESPSATRAHARRCASVRDLPHPHPWPEQGCQIRSRSFEGAIIHGRCIFEVVFELHMGRKFCECVPHAWLLTSPPPPSPPTKSPSPLGESLLVLAHQVPSTGTSLANSLASVCAHGCRVTCTFGIGRSQGSISCTTGVHPQSSSLGDLS